MSEISQSNLDLISLEDMSQAIQGIILEVFPTAFVNVYHVCATSKEIDYTFSNYIPWRFSKKLWNWIIHNDKATQPFEASPLNVLYIPNRENYLHTDHDVLQEDRKQFHYDCNDNLVLLIFSPENLVTFVVTVNDWLSKRPLIGSKKNQEELLSYICNEVTPLTLKFPDLLDQNSLGELSMKDEFSRRFLELNILYDSSNKIHRTFSSNQHIQLLMTNINKVLSYDSCSILLLASDEEPHLYVRLTKPVTTEYLDRLYALLKTSFSEYGDTNWSINHLSRDISSSLTNTSLPPTNAINSNATIPISIEKNVRGLLLLCSEQKDSFESSEITFLHTISTQLSSHLSRLESIKESENLKINSIIESLSEGIIFVGNDQKIKIINPAAESILSKTLADLQSEGLETTLNQLSLQIPYSVSLHDGQDKVNIQTTYLDRTLSVSITPVKNVSSALEGTAITLRDITELIKSNKVKSQRLDIISKVSLLMKSITDLNGLLSVLMEFILANSGAQMGSIQLLEGKSLRTIVHSNFPDKIRREYQFKSGDTLSEFVLKTTKLLYISDYMNDPRVNQETKILIQSYLCLPIMVKNELIGLINIASKIGDPPPITNENEDLETLTTITDLSGTAIQNSLLYLETIEKQKLDQEIRVANEIQTQLLPSSSPNKEFYQFGSISVPARSIGGDYFDFLALPNGNTGLCVADIVGKGIPAGLFMAMLKSIVHRYFKRFTFPHEAMNYVNKVLYDDPVVNKYVPVFYASIDFETNILHYCNAGHEPSLIYRNGNFIFFESNGLPLGAMDDTEYDKKQFQLENGDILCVFTDGITEAKNEEGIQFGLEGLKSFIKEHADLHPKEICNSLYLTIQSYSDQNLSDDITVVLVKYTQDHHLSLDEDPLSMKRVRVTSAKKNVKVIRKEIDRIAANMGFDSSDIHNIKLCVNEAHANVIEHGYGGRETGDILFHFYTFEDRLVIFIKDFGSGTKTKTIKDKEHHLDELEGSGLGVHLIQTLMDDVQYKHTAKVGTELTLTKYLPGKKKETNDGDHQK